jgi:hypothetical protein
VRLQIGQPDSFGRALWLVWPDHWPEGLPVFWFVRGETPEDMHSTTIPAERACLPALIEALDLLLNKD